MEIYLAAPIFTPEQLRVVEYIKTLAEGHNHDVFSPYHNSRDIWKGRAPKDCSPQERAMVLNDNIMNIDWCDCMLAWVGGMGGFTDPGVVWELGYATAKSKLTIGYVDEELDAERKAMNLMLAGTIDVFAATQADLNDILGRLPVDSVKLLKSDYEPAKVIAQELEPIV